MTTCVLELNDTGIRVTCGSELCAESPGYVLIDGKHTVTGKPAQARARLSPRKINTRFWSQLSLEPVNMHSPRVQHTADLAWFHLTELSQVIPEECDALILAVPGTFSKQQLGLLLGIAQECSLPVHGLVDSALVAVASRPTLHNSLYLDIHLHRIVLTHVPVDQGLRRGEVKILTKSGLVSLQEQWAETISDLFVRHTRFDPMHKAQTEQSLYDAMPSWLDSLQREAVIDIELSAGRRDHSVSLSLQVLVDAVSDTYQRVSDQLAESLSSVERAQIVLSRRMRRLPGFVDFINNHLPDCNPVELDEDAVSKGVARFESQVYQSADSLHYITHLQTFPETVQPESGNDRPLYLVCRGHAYSLGTTPLGVSCLSADDEHTITIGRHDGTNVDACCLIHQDNNGVLLEKRGTTKVYVNQSLIDADTHIRVGDSIYVGECSAALLLIELID